MSNITKYTDQEMVEILYQIVFDRLPSVSDLSNILEKICTKKISYNDLLVSFISSAEFIDILSRNAERYHLHFIHNTRIKLIHNIIPQGDVILDIGGANGSLIEYGYKREFQRLIVTDIPPDDRIQELKVIDLHKKWSSHNNIEVILTSMTDLSILDNESIDLVWAGQVVEHISEQELICAFNEIWRVLKKEGRFCFDTPNGIMARIHSPDKFLHPEHKKEYVPYEMRSLLSDHFKIEKELGLLPMLSSYKTKKFSYIEMVCNNTFSENLDYSYIMYFECKKR